MNHIVLLGDSIFDNASYVPGGLPVISHLRAMLPPGWQATLAAVDGSVTTCIPDQLNDVPGAATHLVLSVGGNDGLRELDVLRRSVRTVAEAVDRLAEIRLNFERNYSSALDILISRGKPLAVCTIYDPCYPEPNTQRLLCTALNIFNDCILREAFIRRLPVIDLRLVCTEAIDYANPIEPGVSGGRKIAAAILNLIQTHNFASPKSAIYT
jgi:hypothetical protein